MRLSRFNMGLESVTFLALNVFIRNLHIISDNIY